MPGACGKRYPHASSPMAGKLAAACKEGLRTQGSRDKAARREAGGRRGPGRPGSRHARAAAPLSTPRRRTAGRGTGGGEREVRQTLRRLQAPPQNGGHLWQALFSRRQTTASAVTRPRTSTPFWTIRSAFQARPPPSLRSPQGCGGPRGGTSNRAPRT